jgi:hypothetical protein
MFTWTDAVLVSLAFMVVGGAYAFLKILISTEPDETQ